MGSKPAKRSISTLAVCNEAADLLKSAGFELACTSMRSEACYYKWPGRPGVIRIASHKFSGGMVGLDHVLACLTFPPYKFAKEPDHIIVSRDKVRTMVAIAIGRFFLNPRDLSNPNYHGPKNERP